MKSDLCELAQRIVRSQGNEVCITKDGECTRLYWHLHECQTCRMLRRKNTYEEMYD